MTDVLGLQDKPVLVVGGGSGIGRATSVLLAQVGARVAVADIDGDRAVEVAKEIGGHAIVGDVTEEARATAIVDEAHEALGGLRGVADIVGGATQWGELLSMDLRKWEAELRFNLVQQLLVSQAAARHVLREGGGPGPRGVG